jgi:hypothetical protein
VVWDNGSVFVTNHVLSGALIGRAVGPRPPMALLLGVGSHLVLDAVPHWGCDVEEPGGAELFLTMAKRDGLLGLATMGVATLLAGKTARRATVAAMVGAALLDLDKPIQHFFGWKIFPVFVRRIHSAVQRESQEGMPNEIAAGVAMATADVLAAGWTRRRGAG